MEIMKETPWSRIQRTKQRAQRTLGDCWQWKADGGSVLKETIAVSVTISISVEKVHHQIRLRILSCSRVREKRRGSEVSGEEVPAGDCFDGLARITSMELAPIHFVKGGILQNACSSSRRVVGNLGRSALMHIVRLKNSLVKGPKRMMTRVQWLCWKVHDNGVAYFKTWSRRSLHRFCGRAQTCRNQSNVWNSQSLFHVKLKVENKILRSDILAQVNLMSVAPMVQILRIGPRKRRNGKSDVAREAAWRLAKNILKLKKKDKTAFFSPSENWCLPAPSTLKPEERESVVDSGASMHMISNKDSNSAELETVTTSRSPTTVIPANSEVQTHEEATVCQRIG